MTIPKRKKRVVSNGASLWSMPLQNSQLVIVNCEIIRFKMCLILTHSFAIDLIFYTYECLLEILQVTQQELSTMIFQFYITFLGLIIGRRWYWWSQKMNILLQCLHKSLTLYQQFPYWTTFDILSNWPIGFKKYVRNKLKIFQMFRCNAVLFIIFMMCRLLFELPLIFSFYRLGLNK